MLLISTRMNLGPAPGWWALTTLGFAKKGWPSSETRITLSSSASSKNAGSGTQFGLAETFFESGNFNLDCTLWELPCSLDLGLLRIQMQKKRRKRSRGDPISARATRSRQGRPAAGR